VYRPTAQVVRGSVFDTLGERIEHARFLDLFAGSGAVGIEALSRGADRAVFVEQDHRILRALRTNLERCRFGRDVAEVRMSDAMRYLKKFLAREEVFDIIFADPPYSGNLAQEVVSCIEQEGRRCCGLLAIEHGSALFNREAGPLSRVKTRKFGQSFVTYFEFMDNDEE
jgi:16S rRNA (guanine(966)-N(2))-methyltransferase RsmD